MDIYRTLQTIVKGSRYNLDRNRAEEPIVIIRGVRHFGHSLTEDEILRTLRPRIILTEDLVDSRYIAADDRFEPGNFYRTGASPIQRNLMDDAPLLSAGRHLKIDVVGIGSTDHFSDLEEEGYLFSQIAAQAQRGELLYATVGHNHIMPSSELIQKLNASEISGVILRMK